jgi:hypothetical protein
LASADTLIPAHRTCIVFTDLKPGMWARNGETFG